MKKELLKEIVERLLEKKGMVRGEKFRTHAAYIKQKKGVDGLRAVENAMKEIGHPFKFNDIRSLDWYPVGLSPAVIIIAKDLFEWNDKDIFDMGYSAPNYSFIFKMTLRIAVSIEKMLKGCSSYWYKNYDFGRVEAFYNEKEKKIIAKILDFKLDPIMCSYLQGYILRMLQYVIKGIDATIEETKCVHKGDPYEEYVIKWK